MKFFPFTSEIQFSARTISNYKSILENVFEREGVEKKKQIQNLRDQLETVTKRKTKIQEEYMDGNLPSKEYQELKMNLDNRSFELNRELQELSSVSSPFKEYLNKYVPLMEDLVGFYRRSSGEVKKKILGCIFSKKFHFQDGKAAAVEFTLPVQILINASKSFEGKKKEKEVKNDLLSCFAPQTGLEPVTL